MKIINEIIDKQVSRKWKVPSKSRIGVWYEVRELNGELKCNCYAGARKQPCTHRQIIQQKYGI